MTVYGRINSDSNRLSLKAFPVTPIKYTSSEPNPSIASDYTRLKVRTSKTEEPTIVFIENKDLQSIGLSLSVLTPRLSDSKVLSRYLHIAHIVDKYLKAAIPIVSEHLQQKHLNFFIEMPRANRDICNFLYEGKTHQSKKPETPGLYKYIKPEYNFLFINLKKTKSVGQGTFGKVKKALFLNHPSNNPMIVAKKVLLTNPNANPRNLEFDIFNFEKEISTLEFFLNKPGIIKIIAAGSFEGKRAIFMPLYDCSLYEFAKSKPFSLSVSEKLEITSQLLKGLSTISESGVHGDVKSLNILIKKKNDAVEGVISDFGAFRSYKNLEHGLTTFRAAPPEYFRENKVSLKHDTWGMGISLFELFSRKLPNWIHLYKEPDLISWTSNLSPRWIDPFLNDVDAPFFIKELICQMLDPRENNRLSPKEAFEIFSSAYASYLQSIAESS